MNFHVLRASDNGVRLTVVFHVPVPDAPNGAGRPLRGVLAGDPGHDRTSKLPDITQPELTQIAQGQIIEVVRDIEMRGSDDAARRAEVERAYRAVARETLATMAERYRLYGLEGDVV